MVISSVFALNLFCSFISCTYKHEFPSNPTAAVAVKAPQALLRRSRASLLPRPFVITNDGAVEGYIMTAVEGRAFYAFEGIPYGEPPVGNLRFKAPKRRKPWKGILQAKSPGSKCAQVNSKVFPNIQGSEDCLYANIYTPKIGNQSTNKLPVIVYLHGGAFGLSSGSESGPAYMLNHDVVLVTFNYRLGVLGFLSTGDKASPGNYGLKDQALALEWVSENIGHFGGNASLVTIFGSSAGAAAAHMHILSNRTRKYFSAGVSASGTGFNPWAVQTHAQTRHMNRKLAKRTGCPLGTGTSTTTAGFVACLRKMNVFDLVRQQSFLYDWFVVPAVLFGPVVEPALPGAFLSEHPKEIYARGGAAKYPWIFTNVKDECDDFIMVLDSFGLMPQILTRWPNVAPLILDYENREPDQRLNAITQNISNYYFGKPRPVLSDGHQLGNAWSDRYFNFPTHEVITAHSQLAPTYAAVFAYKGYPSVAEYYRLDRNKWGVSHGEDEYYYFNKSQSFPGFKTTNDEYNIVRFLTSAIASFAKTRVPTYESETGQVSVWKEIKDPKNVEVLYIDKDIIEMVPEPRKIIYGLWEELNLV